MNNLRNKIILILFSLFICTVGAITITKEQDKISFTENRELTTFPSFDLQGMTSGSFQSQTDRAFSDQFLGRNTFLNLYTKMNLLLKKATYKFISTEDSMLLVSISDGGIFKIGLNGEYLTEYPFIKTEEMNNMLNVRVFNYNEIQEKYPELDMYLYKVTNIRDTNWFDEANDIQSGVEYYRNWLLGAINPNITYREHTYTDFEEYKLNNYKTDHHWNMYGAYIGYQELIEMVSEKYPEIGKAKEPIDSFVVNVPFYGSLVKKSNYSLDSNIYDKIGDFVYDLPPYKVTVNGEEAEDFGRRNDYRNGINIDSTKGVNHYREMFGADSAEVIYDFGDNTGVNALFISDSYTNAIKPVLASHFDKTVFLDLRQPFPSGELVNLEEYMQKYDFDVMVYVGGFFSIYMDEPFIINNY